jgi:hypothetical protein
MNLPLAASIALAMALEMGALDMLLAVSPPLRGLKTAQSIGDLT